MFAKTRRLALPAFAALALLAGFGPGRLSLVQPAWAEDSSNGGDHGGGSDTGGSGDHGNSGDHGSSGDHGKGDASSNDRGGADNSASDG